MKKTATLIALAGLSMAAKTEHSFLGKKPVEISSEIDPKMVIRPPHDIDPGMVRKPHKNIDKGIFVKPKKPQATISADDNDDELLLIYRPADNIDPGMVRRPPVGSEIDPKFVIKPPRDFDRGIFVRPRPRTEPVWVDDEMMRVISGTEVDPGMVIKPKRGDIDPGMVRKPVKGWEIDPKIFVKPKRGDVVYADDDEMMVRRPPVENIKYLDAENDDELAFVSSKQVREPRLIGDFPTKSWPGAPVYADAEDNELIVIANKTKPAKERRWIGDFPINWPGKPVYADAGDDELHVHPAVSDQGVANGKSHDDELMYQRLPIAVSDLGVRGMGHLSVRDDEFAVASNRTKQVREPRYIGDFPTHWPGKPVYADAEDDELAVFANRTTKFVREPRWIGDFPINWPGKPVYADAEDDELAQQMTEFVREPRIIGEHGKSADDELVYASNRIDPGMVRRPQPIDQGMIRRPRPDIKYYDAENDDELIMFADHSLDRPRRGVFEPKEWAKPWSQQQQTMYADDADDELIMFADKSLDARLERRKVPFDLKELTKPWYQQQQTMYADDALVALGELLEDN